ncbi:LPS export ABC transporter periplasmic protein LptC [Leptospira gomenensis]|uniref:LPS export ABC transporter periplasmic protein LptC n=1 Tax=Leptospira gomenensis TaxID=2484974 RepID=A0A5F1YCX0_9LEPT|nr:LPS export ABC transporter periplasmic protein LptC [Leptospira gomenensis]TGK35049.1 LPS export ABC transporter periplasmic protein LptC [Leptospira gomenensis]TGK35273.1 LPS export ABC transporter periplasmic protein LptC [Leptospira gomenensis]TGK51758.1 LPS export ABC transporter periplasmic protein LptC [Leptospira gomenensis]TGK58353.1 LPS export ABC transporter periplasmic protein LptC [Leptospira gomenensis]
MKRPHSFRSRIFLISSFILCAPVLTDCRKTNYERVEKERESGASVSIRNFKRTAYDQEGKLQWELKAQESYVYVNENKTIFYNIDFDQFEDGKFKSKLLGEKGEINHKTRLMTLEGKIFLRTNDDKTLNARAMEYNMDTKKLISDSEVTVSADGTTIHGVGLRADKDLNKFTILRPTAVTRGGTNPLKAADSK